MPHINTFYGLSVLFTTETFLLYFLPPVLLLYYALGRWSGQGLALSWLVVASLTFYCYWKPEYLAILIASILVNFTIGRILQSHLHASLLIRRATLASGILFNLGLLGYFKYTHFIVNNISFLSGSGEPMEALLLPLAISFFTFQQIAFLVDAYSGLVKDRSFLHYSLFVSFFPQLIAGPIVHHKEIIPQFTLPNFATFHPDRLIIGMIFFFSGLFKKLILADNLALHADPVFNAALSGAAIGAFDAWIGTLSYTFQIYFDFSGYSDMAIGLAWMFGIRLPANFASPYKALSIIEFWRRWHITLSRFLKDYLYIPLGGNRHGQSRRFINLGITMLLGGLWHGAGWGFILWGALHGVYLIINHAFHALRSLLKGPRLPSWVTQPCCFLLTFFAVSVSWVFFRAETLDAAMLILSGLFSPLQASTGGSLKMIIATFPDAWTLIYESWKILHSAEFLLLLAGSVAWLLPNTNKFVRRFVVDESAQSVKEQFNRSAWAGAAGIAIGMMSFVWLLSTFAAAPAKFIYFNF